MGKARNNVDKLRSFVFVNEAQYGAKADGFTDDTAAIQACINANPGRLICFAGGNYKVTSEITVSADNTRLYGFGRDATIISTVSSGNVFKFFSTSTNVLSFLNNCGIEGFYIYRNVLSSTGAGVRLVQCNNFVLKDLTVLALPEGIKVLGGQLSSFTNFTIFGGAMNDISGTTDSSLLSFLEAPCDGGVFQPCFTVRVTDFSIGASSKVACAVLVGNADGFQASDAYINGATDSLLRFRNQRDGSYIAGVTVSNFYFDCVAKTTKYGIDFPSDGFASAFLYNIDLSNCFIGGSGLEGGIATKPISNLTLNGCTFANIFLSAFSFQALSSNGSLNITGCRFQTTGTSATFVPTVLISGSNSVVISSNTFASNQGTDAVLKFQGSNGRVVISSNIISNGLVDFSNTGSISDFSATGNVTATTTRNIDKNLTGTTTPTLTIGGVSTGITYATQLCNYEVLGNIVYLYMVVALTNKGAATGTVKLTGVPFPPANNTPVSLSANLLTAGVGDTHLSAYLSGGGATTVELFKMSGGNLAFITDVDLTNTSVFRISGTFQMA